MKPSEYLISKGWRKVGVQKNAVLWDHPEHQHTYRGCFTTLDATEHQKALDKGDSCDCLKEQR